VKGARYDIPAYDGESPSPALSAFLRHWFENSRALTRGEVDLGFLSDLSEEELEYARDLLRRNLHLGYTHIVEGVAALRDLSAVPALRAMLDREEDLSRRLTIAGTLWRLTRDEVFVESLLEMKGCDDAVLRQAHIDQVLWLADERALAMLVDLLDDPDPFVRFLALARLNEIESDERFFVPESALPHQASYYRSRRDDAEFAESMVGRLKGHVERYDP